MENKIKNVLTRANGAERKRYVTDINTAGRDVYSPEEEFALTRKLLTVFLQEKLEHDPTFSARKEVREYLEYTEFFEKTKEIVQDNMK